MNRDTTSNNQIHRDPKDLAHVDELADLKLFRLVAEGDKDAFHKVFDRYVPYVTAIAKRIIGHGAICEDLVQDIFLKIWEKKEELVHVECPKAWIARVSMHACYNRVKHEMVRAKASSNIRYITSEHANNVEESMQLAETAAYVYKAIEQLPSQTKTIYKLNKEDGMKIGEIAEHLHLSPQTVKNTLSTAVKRVKLYLQEQGIAHFLIFFYSISTFYTLGCLGI